MHPQTRISCVQKPKIDDLLLFDLSGSDVSAHTLMRGSIMKIQCPQCGASMVVNGLGRKPLNRNVLEVCDALRTSSTVGQAAKKLGVSRPYLYKVLKANGLTMKEVLNNKLNIKGFEKNPRG